jgi:hypothetical protein
MLMRKMMLKPIYVRVFMWEIDVNPENLGKTVSKVNRLSVVQKESHI